MTLKMIISKFKRNLFGLLWVAGGIGELSTLWIEIPSQTTETLPLPIFTLKLIGLYQSLVIISIAVRIGVACAQQLGLSAPFSEAMATPLPQRISHHSKSSSPHRPNPWPSLQKQLLPGLIGGVISISLVTLWYSLMKAQLPAAFLNASETTTLPFLTRLLKGGIAEEIVMRWGFMTFLIWLCWRFLQRRKRPPHAGIVIGAIILSSLLFGLLHLPAASLMVEQLTTALVLYIIIGNTVFGIVAGYLYWKVGLESAIIAHMVFHSLLVTLQSLIPLLFS